MAGLDQVKSGHDIGSSSSQHALVRVYPTLGSASEEISPLEAAKLALLHLSNFIEEAGKLSH